MDPLALQGSQVPSDDGGLAVEVEDAVGGCGWGWLRSLARS